MEIDRRKRIIEEIGGAAPGDDTAVGVPWRAMDQATRTHVSSKIDTHEVEYSDLREAVMRYTSLVRATSASRAPTAMDIWSIGQAKKREVGGGSMVDRGRRRLGRI